MKVNCPSCFASLMFDATSGKMECRFCGCSFSLEDVADQEEKELAASMKKESSDTMECNIYSCTACGAELSVNGVEASTFCAYCGQPTIVFSRVSQELRPEWIIPFKVPKEQAVEAIRGRFRQGMFIPKEVKDFEVERVRGIYIPYWLFDTYHYDKQLIKGTVGSGKRSRTKYFMREAECEFHNLSIDASSKLNDESSQRLEPFDMEDMRAFEVAYMSGYYADRYDQSAGDLEGTAYYRSKELFDEKMLESVNARSKKIESSGPTHRVLKKSYALFPAWFMTFRYQDRPYTMLVNGQTGKLVGAVPYDTKKVVATLILTFLAAAAVFIPTCIGLISSMWMDEDLSKLLFLMAAAAFGMGSSGYRKMRRAQENQKLTASTQIIQYAHNRQEQSGGAYQ